MGLRSAYLCFVIGGRIPSPWHGECEGLSLFSQPVAALEQPATSPAPSCKYRAKVLVMPTLQDGHRAASGTQAFGHPALPGQDRGLRSPPQSCRRNPGGVLVPMTLL